MGYCSSAGCDGLVSLQLIIIAVGLILLLLLEFHCVCLDIQLTVKSVHWYDHSLCLSCHEIFRFASVSYVLSGVVYIIYVV